MQRPPISLSGMTALRAAQGAAGPADSSIESALLEVERERGHGRDNSAEASSLQRPSLPARSRGGNLPRGNLASDEEEHNNVSPGQTDASTVKKIVKDVVHAVDKQYGGLVSRLRGRMRDYEKRVDFARHSSEQWLVEKNVLEDRIEDLKFETSDLRDQMASAVASASGGQGIQILGSRKGQTMEQKMKNMNSGMGFDVDVEGMEQDTGILSNIAIHSVWTRCWQRARRTCQRYKPLERDIKLVSSQYGRSCGGFFVFHRFLGFLSCLMLVLYVPLLVFQALNESDERFTGMCGKLPFGCGWLYGGFYKAGTTSKDDTRDAWQAFRYLATTVISSLGVLCYSLTRWGYFDFTYQSDELGEELQPRQWSRITLAAWDFRLRPGEDRKNFELALANQLRSELDDEKEIEKKDKRTTLQLYLLYLRRACGMLVNLCLIGGAWMAISFANFYSFEIQSAVTTVLGDGIGQQVSAFAPNIIVALVGSILPTTTKKITAFEAWSPTMQSKQDLWRLYLGKILNIFIFVSISVELVVGKPLFGQQQVLAQRDLAYRCVEDQAATKLLSLVASELLLSLAFRPVSSLLSAYVFHLLFKSLNISNDFKRPVFDMADYGVDIIYFQCLLWSTAIWVPSLVIFAPVMLFVHFKWLKFTLLRLSSRPFVAETAALSVTLLQLTCVSCLISVAMCYALATKGLPHALGCGPFESEIAPGIMLGRIDVTGVETVKSILIWCEAHPGVILPVFAFFIFLWLSQRNGAKALQAALGQVQNIAHRQVEALEAELWRMERQNEVLNRRVQFHEKSSSD